MVLVYRFTPVFKPAADPREIQLAHTYILVVTRGTTFELSGTELRRLRLLVLGGIIENQNSDFVMQ